MKPVEQRVETAPLATPDRPGEKISKHLDGHFPVHQLGIIQRPQEQILLSFVAGAVEFSLSSAPGFHRRVRRLLHNRLGGLTTGRFRRSFPASSILAGETAFLVLLPLPHGHGSLRPGLMAIDCKP